MGSNLRALKNKSQWCNNNLCSRNVPKLTWGRDMVQVLSHILRKCDALGSTLVLHVLPTWPSSPIRGNPPEIINK